MYVTEQDLDWLLLRDMKEIGGVIDVKQKLYDKELLSLIDEDHNDAGVHEQQMLAVTCNLESGILEEISPTYTQEKYQHNELSKPNWQLLKS